MTYFGRKNYIFFLSLGMSISAPFDPYYWVTPSGARIERSKLMVTLTNLEGVYIRASYGLDSDGQSRLSNVALDSAIEVPGDRDMTEQDIADQVTRYVFRHYFFDVYW